MQLTLKTTFLNFKVPKMKIQIGIACLVLASLEKLSSLVDMGLAPSKHHREPLLEGAYYARTILTKSFVSSIPSTPASLLEPELMAR